MTLSIKQSNFYITQRNKGLTQEAAPVTAGKRYQAIEDAMGPAPIDVTRSLRAIQGAIDELERPGLAKDTQTINELKVFCRIRWCCKKVTWCRKKPWRCFSAKAPARASCCTAPWMRSARRIFDRKLSVGRCLPPRRKNAVTGGGSVQWKEDQTISGITRLLRATRQAQDTVLNPQRDHGLCRWRWRQ